MSNTQAPRGFAEANFYAGQTGTYGLQVVPMAYNASAVYKGDFLKLSSGKAAVATVTGNTGAAVLGAAVSFKWNSIAQQKVVWQTWYPGSDSVGNADIECWMQNNPHALFDVQVNGGPAVQADVGSFFNFATGTGNNSVGFSGWSLDYASKNATQGTLPFVLHSLLQQPVTDPTSAYNLVRVGFSTRTLL